MESKKNIIALAGLILFSVALAIGINSCWKMSETGVETQKTSVTERP